MARERDQTGLAWSGRPPTRSSGGFVDGVALNERLHELAVDPDGVVAEERAGSHRGGANVTLERLGSTSDGPVQPSGRVRLTST